MNILTGISSTVAALDAERLRMDVVSQNLANIHTTRDANGMPYQRKKVVFQAVLDQATASPGSPGTARVEAKVLKDTSPPMMVRDPGHPDANADGMVAMPNINVMEEMVDMIAANRAFEANLAAIKMAKATALKTLSIGK